MKWASMTAARGQFFDILLAFCCHSGRQPRGYCKVIHKDMPGRWSEGERRSSGSKEYYQILYIVHVALGAHHTLKSWLSLAVKRITHPNDLMRCASY
jgi:hypothetical protein